jgi:uncharacterized membrane protein
VVVTLNVAGNVLLAWGMKHLPEAMGFDPLGYIRAMFSPFVALGVALLMLWMLTRMTLMSWADLSFVLPVTSIGFVLAAGFGKICLGETITLHRWLGIVLIFAGSLVVGTTIKHSHASPPASGRQEK